MRIFLVLLLTVTLAFQASHAGPINTAEPTGRALLLLNGLSPASNLEHDFHADAEENGVISVFNLEQYRLDYFNSLTPNDLLKQITTNTDADVIYHVNQNNGSCSYLIHAIGVKQRNYYIESYLDKKRCLHLGYQEWLRSTQTTPRSENSQSVTVPTVYFSFTERDVEKIDSTQTASVSRKGTTEQLAQASEIVVYSYPITAEENVDFVPFSKVIRFEPGQTRVLFTFEVFESDGVADEFGIGLRYPVNAVIPDTPAEGSVLTVKLFSDVVKDEFKITYPKLSFYSEGEEYTLTVARKNTAQTQAVEYATVLDGLGAEFTTNQTNFVFTPGVEKMDLKFIVNDDFRFNRELRSATFNFKQTPKIVFPEGASATFKFSDNNKAERGVFGFEYSKYVLDNGSELPAVKIVRTSSTKGAASFNLLIKDESSSFSKESVVTFADGEFEMALNLEGIPVSNAVIRMELTPLIDVLMANASSEIQFVDVNGGGSGIDQVAVESSILNAAENIGEYTFPLKRIGALDYLGVVTVKDAGGSAKEGVDYTIKANTITYGVGVQAQSIQLAITNDDVFTGEKEIKLSLSSPNLKVPAKEIIVNIVEDDFEKLGTVSFKASQMNVEEEQLAVPVVITRDLAGPAFDFDISLVSGTAVIGKDVEQLQNQTVRFETGQTVVTVYLNMIGDTIPDFDKEFTVKISSAQPIRFASSSMKITIIDNEKAKAIYVKPTGQGIVTAQGQSASLTTSAGDKMIKVTLTRTVNTNEAFRLFVKSSDGTAKSGSHYGQVDEALIFAQGETTKTITLVLKKAEIVGAYQDFDLNFTADSPNFIVESPALKVKITPGEVVVAPGEGGSSGGVFGGLLAALLVICLGRRKAVI